MFEVDDDGPSGGRIPYLPDLHLRNPIRISERRLFQLAIPFYETRSLTHMNAPPFIKDTVVRFFTTVDRRATRGLCPKEHKIRIDSESLYGKIFNLSLVNIPESIKEGTGKLLEEARSITAKLVGPVLDTCTLQADTKTAREKWEKYLDNPSCGESFLPDYFHTEYWSKVRNLMASSVADSKDICVLPYPGQDTVIVTQKFTFMLVEGEWFVFDYDQVLMICDVLLARRLILFSSEVYSKLGFNYLPSVCMIRKIFSWGDDCLSDLGNNSYGIIKMFEPLITAEILNKFEVALKCKRYLVELKKEATNEGFINYINKLEAILNSEDMDANQFFELSGLFRLFGHPTIDEHEGMRKQREQVNLDVHIDQEMVAEASGGLIRLIVTEYVSKHRRWPKCKIREGTNPSEEFRTLVKTQSTIIDERLKLVGLGDWACLQFDKNSEFDDVVDFTELVADKSCSLPREEFHLAYSPYRTHSAGVQRSNHSRRLLTEILSDPEFDPVKLRKMVQSRKLPLAWFIVGLCSKERELKITGRMFTLLAAPIRYIFGVTQKNIADSIMPYVRGQTMTLSDAQLVNKMYAHTTPTTDTQECKAVFSIDFEKFNQRWRRESIWRTARMFDEWFGTKNVFSFVHDFFDKALFYLCSSFEPLDNLRKPLDKRRECYKRTPTVQDVKNPKGDTVWIGQKGAGEGLWQKGWTLIIIGALHAIEFKTGIHSSIMGQGDNQVIVISWRIPYLNMDQDTYIQNYQGEFNQIIDTYLQELTTIVNGLGMRVKLEETWISTKFLSYGKEPWFRGVFMSTVLKRRGRTFLEVNDIHPTVANRIGAVMSAGYSTATKDFHPSLAYLISVHEAVILLRKETEYSPTNGTLIKQMLKKKKTVLSSEMILMALILPKEFGGFPTIPFPEFLFRGHPDPVTSGLIWIKICAKFLPQARALEEWITGREGLNQRKDVERLILDPVALNFKSYGQYSNRITEILDEAVARTVRNRQVKMLINSKTTEYKTNHRALCAQGPE